MPELPLQFIESPPLNPGPGAPPLLVTFHGYGSHMGDLHELRQVLDDRFHVISAQAPVDLSRMGMPGGWAWFDLVFTPGEGIGYDPAGAEQAIEQADAFLVQALEHSGADPDRVFLLGFSQGSMIAHALLLRGQVPVAGIAACSGRLVEEVFGDATSAEHLDGRRLFVSHGRFDDVIPVDCGRRIRDWYASTPVVMEYHEYDMAHGIDPDCARDLAGWCRSAIDSAKTGS